MRREEIRWDRPEQGIGASMSRVAANPFFENTWEISLWQKNHRQEFFFFFVTLKCSFPYVFLSLSLPQEMSDRKDWAGGLLLKRETMVLNSPELWAPTVEILKASDRRCSSKEFETLNLIASFVSVSEGGWGIWRGSAGSWRKDTNLWRGMLPECRSWTPF